VCVVVVQCVVVVRLSENVCVFVCVLQLYVSVLMSS